MKYLYQYKVKEHLEPNNENAIKYDVFTPSIRGGVLLFGESRKIKTILSRFMFQILTLGKAKIFYVRNDSELIHTSYVIPKCLKFTFMNKNDYEIGPCFTYPKHRGKGIYPKLLRSICHCVGSKDTVFYMIVDEKNVASIKGIEKAGFTKCGLVKVSKVLKRYSLVE